MKTQITAVELFYLNKEIQICSNSKIDNIFHPTRDQLVFRLYKKDHPKIFLSLIPPKYLYLAQTTPPSPPQPSAFCTYLRKHLSGGWIESIGQVGAERIVSMVVSKKDATFNIFFEFFGRGNIIITKKEGDEWIIQSATLYKTWNNREVKRHQPYELPPATTPFHQTSIEKLKDDIAASEDIGLAKFVATQYGLGGPYAKELCITLDLKQSTPIHSLEDDQLKGITIFFEQLAQKTIEPTVVKDSGQIKDLTPFPLSFYEDKEVETKKDITYSSLFDDILSHNILSEIKDDHLKTHTAKEKKLMAIVKQQKLQLEKLQNDIETNTASAEFIYAHYQQMSTLLEHIQTLEKNQDSKTFKKTLEALAYVKQVDQKNKRVTLDIESIS